MQPISPHLGHDDPLCGQCSRQSGGCCVTTLEDTAYCFPLSEKEITRLLPYAHLAAPLTAEEKTSSDAGRAAVCSMQKNSEEFLKSMRYLFPSQPKKITELFPSDAMHYRLRLNDNGACTFLGEHGCRLPRGVRPWYCLLFPVWYQSGQLTVFLSDVCLATRDISDPLLALQRLDVPEQTARQIYRRLTADWGFTDD